MSTPIQKLFDLSGQTALITGGSRGLGLQIAEALGEAGAKIFLTSRKAADLEEAAAQLQAKGIDARWVAADVSQPAEVERVATEALQRLGDIATKVPVTCLPTTSLREALTIMMQRRIGSIIVVDSAGALLGILTRYDILGRVTLPGVPLDCPIREVMVSPVLSLTDDHTAQDAAMLMSANGIRHVPVTRSGQVVTGVSEGRTRL